FGDHPLCKVVHPRVLGLALRAFLGRRRPNAIGFTIDGSIKNLSAAGHGIEKTVAGHDSISLTSFREFNQNRLRNSCRHATIRARAGIPRTLYEFENEARQRARTSISRGMGGPPIFSLQKHGRAARATRY